MTLLSICQRVANKIPVAAPTSIINNTDETAVRLLAAAQDAGDELARAPQGGWVSMILEYDFYSQAVAQQPGTMTNVGGFGVITGLATTTNIAAGSWYAFGNGCPNNSVVTAVTSSTVTINQAPTTTGAGNYNFGRAAYDLPSDFNRVIDNTMWDRSRYWSMRGPQSPQQWQLYKSSVIGQASIQRRFRFRQINGAMKFSIDPTPTDNNAAFVFEYVSNAWCKSASGTPQTSWQADTDLGILDEYLLYLGTLWQALARFGFPYAAEQDMYEKQLSKAMAVDGGSAILSLAPRGNLHLIGPYQVPETGFGP